MIGQSGQTLIDVNNHRSDIDGLKALAIIAVVLYHMGIATYGYLGVDVFFVISGFLFMNSLKKRKDKKFSFFQELSIRLTRLYPLVLLAGIVCLGVGFLTMLPDDYENLSQSVIATNISANNVLAYITTGNYWEVANELKPLMHIWYLGILVQFYVAFLLIYKLIDVAVKKERQTSVLIGVLVMLTAISLTIYCLPVFDNNMKFYLLPFRFFELAAGSIVALLAKATIDKKKNGICLIALLALTMFLLLPFKGWHANCSSLLLTILCTISLLVYNQNRLYRAIVSNKVIVLIGKASFSIYIWHQIVLAFARYTITAKLSLVDAFIYFTVVAGLSALSYFIVEKKLGELIREYFNYSIVIVIVLITLISGMAGIVYLRAGIVRDVPELEIDAQNISRGMHSQYNHRIWELEKVFFESNGKTNVLVVGNSYARDWANVLLESQMKDSINISYAYSWDDSLITLIKTADYVFSHGVLQEDIPDYVWMNVKDKSHVYGLGTKRFGENNGIIYSQRFKDDYLRLTVLVPDSIEKTNTEFANSWGNHYVNFIAMVQNPDGTVPVFTQEGKYISQDCWHLTKAGAVMYAGLVKWDSIFVMYR